MLAPSPRRRTFYVALACVSAIIALIGFSRRYVFPLAAGTMDAPAIVHLHGLIMFVWVGFLIVQTVLVARGRTSLHRSLGLAGISLVTLLVFTGAQLAILLLARELRVGGPPHLREFVATLLSWAVLIAGLFSFAIAYVKRPEVHKRLIVLATTVILTAAFARIIQLLDGDIGRLLRNDLAAIPSDALIVVGIIHDWRTRGRPHPSYLISGAAIVVVQLATLALRTTSAWYDATTWLAGLVS